jgi:polysaccharide export outer membrane protein
VYSISVLCSSCASVSVVKYKYFADVSDSAKITKIATSNYEESTIQSDDILYVAIYSVDASTPVTSNVVSVIPGVNPNSIPTIDNQLITSGYTIDKTGNVTLPIIGSLHIEGLTIPEARDKITEVAAKFYKAPTVIVRYLNFKITILGEVNHPGSFNIPNEKLNLLDAIGYAGDLTIYGKRSNVLLIRKQPDGVVNFVRINLNNTDFMKSPYFYLKENDVIYVETLKTKITGSDASQARNLTIASLAITIIAVLLTRIK